MADYLLDTCTAIWLMNGEPLQEPARTELPRVLKRNERLLVSPFTAWEIATLSAKKKIRLTLRPEIWFRKLCDLPGVSLAGLPPSVFIASTALPAKPPADPADRILIATAREFDYTLVTRDRQILEYAKSGQLRALAC
ncbi:MAG: type II toxin-antitoxin system VapC family toxin [Gammaproteobacteria bacterium]|nr:type II toxin-antitoxin system VapC family toxin [Gammaproteobacteria bacterium]MCY4338592.1 type II toxin-antitoxin system VapC family toxin [Gammaproteobacteria bacterium]